MDKLLVILGPTGTGKTDLSIKLAKRFNGEVISADSRQVYRGLDIGTGKITAGEMDGVKHHLLDVADPGVRFTVVDWRILAKEAIENISDRQKLPIICGGAGYYISALINNLNIPDVKIDPKDVNYLESKSTEELYHILKKLDPDRSSKIDPQNKRRLVRAIMIARTLGRVPSLKIKSIRIYDTLLIGLIYPDKILKEHIKTRLINRIDSGMIEEAFKLHKSGLTFKRMKELGLEYRYLAELLQKKITKEDLNSILSAKIWQYAKRQKTWFKKESGINWFDVSKSDYLKKVEKLVEKWHNN